MPMISTDSRIKYELLEITAAQLGIPASRFREMVREVEAIAESSPTWGQVDERLAELQRRISQHE